MASEHNHQHELLSAYLDGELSESESARLEKAMANQADLRTQLEDLKQIRALAAEHFQSIKAEADKQPVDLTTKVMAAISATEAWHQRMPAQVAVRSAISSPESTSHRRRRMALAVVVAACVLIAAFPIVRFWQGPGQGDNGASDSLAANNETDAQIDNEAGTGNPFAELAQGEGTSNPFTNSSVDDPPETDAQWVSQMNFGLVYILEVDVQISTAAYEAGVLDGILQASKILDSEPIVANQAILEAIEASRMNVRQGAAEGPSEAFIYFVRAPISNLGIALDAIFQDQTSFPEVAFTLGFDSPRTRLMKTIAENSGQQFAVNQSFVAPVTVEQADDGARFGVDLPSQYVSRQARPNGIGELSALQVQQADASLENLLLFVRVVE